jgi:dihydrofolate synthase / folylpolyglutamate synthase
VPWTLADAEAYIASLEPIGWRFGLDRIKRLADLLGMPQRRFASIHVVGTNGKSSVAMMAVALLEAKGIPTGAYVSPHAERWTERVMVRAGEIEPDAFARAVERVAETIPAVERKLDADDAVTQFEAVTAAAFVGLATARVEVGVIEAGLGGRLDATNVLHSRVTALTSVGLEHTQWLGDTEVEIAGEKLAVLRDHSVLVLGAVSPDVRALAERTASERHALLVDASEPPDLVALKGRAPYLRRNFAVALAAVEALAGPLGRDLVERVAGELELHGRMELVPGDPPEILDAAHNPAGARALAEALPEAVGEKPVVACLAVLSDKDAPALIAELAPRLDAAVLTELPVEELAGAGRPVTSTHDAGQLAAIARAARVRDVEVIRDPDAGVARARELARGRGGVALVSGSHYLLGHGS